MLKRLLIFLSVSMVLGGYSQSGTLNLEDEQGRQGYWIIWGSMNPDKGYCDTCRIQEGNYINGRKEGIWIKYHKDGFTPRLRGTYVDNRPNGIYSKYHRNGLIQEEGSFKAGKQTQVYNRYYDNGCMSTETIFNADSTQVIKKINYRGPCDTSVSIRSNLLFDMMVPSDRDSGRIYKNSYYHPNGNLEFCSYQYFDSGRRVGEAKRYYANGDLRELIRYDEDGVVESRVEYSRINEAYVAPITFAERPYYNPLLGHVLDGVRFKKNGYNRVYNTNQEVLLEGDFKHGYLWNGKLYKYDSDGVLMKIEKYRKGKYYAICSL